MLASAPARKCDDKRAEQPVAAETRRLPYATDPTNNQAQVIETPEGYCFRAASAFLKPIFWHVRFPMRIK